MTGFLAATARLAACCALSAAAASFDVAPSADVPLDGVPPQLAEVLHTAYAEAEQSVAQALDATGRANAWGKLGMIYHGQRLREQAKAAYERALAQAEVPRWRYLRGIALSEQGDIRTAAADFQRVVDAAPDDGVAHYRLGVARSLLGELDAAQRELEAARDLMPDSALVLAALADLASARGDPAQVLDLLQRAWRLEPEAGQLAYKLAMAQRGLGNLEAAREWLARQPDNSLAPSIDDPALLEVARTSRSPRFLEAAANWALARGDTEEAANVLAEAALLAPKDTALGLRLVGLLGSSGRTEEALAQTRRILAVENQSAMAWYLLAWLLRNAEAAERRAEAGAAAQRALELTDGTNATPVPEKVHALAAALAMRDGDAPVAQAHYQRLAADHPENALYRYWLALALLADGDCSGRRPLMEALRLRPNWGEAHLVLARADALCGNARNAERRAHGLMAAKDDAETRITLAFAAHAHGDMAEAKRLANAELPHEDAQALLDVLQQRTDATALRVFAKGSRQWLPSEVRGDQPSPSTSSQSE